MALLSQLVNSLIRIQLFIPWLASISLTAYSILFYSFTALWALLRLIKGGNRKDVRFSLSVPFRPAQYKFPLFEDPRCQIHPAKDGSNWTPFGKFHWDWITHHNHRLHSKKPHPPKPFNKASLPRTFDSADFVISTGWPREIIQNMGRTASFLEANQSWRSYSPHERKQMPMPRERPLTFRKRVA